MTAQYQDMMTLAKPRIVVLALLMATLGYSFGVKEPWDLIHFFATLLGIGLIGIAACALNQYVEQDVDAKMWRTMKRPLPSGRMNPKPVLYISLAVALLGELILVVFVNGLTAFLGAVTVLSYMGIYTPSKKETPLSTLIGAIPGALPPLMGSTAASGTFTPMGILFFLILFIWQIPHFLAIGWLYREDYSRADLPILSVIDLSGTATAKQVVVYSLALIPLTLLPTVWGLTGVKYMFGAIALGVGFLVLGILLAAFRTRVFARILFFASIVYLPALGVMMIWDRIRV